MWRELAIGLMAVVITGAAAWMVFGTDKVTRPEMVAFMDKAGSWNQDKGEITTKMVQTSIEIGKVENVLMELQKGQQQLLVEQRVLAEKFELMAKGK